MKYLAKVWTSALTFGALMVAGSTGVSAHRVNNSQRLNNLQHNHQTSTKVVNQKHSNHSTVYPLYHFWNDQNQFRLGSVAAPHHYARHYIMRKQINRFRISHHHYIVRHYTAQHIARHDSSHSKADKSVKRLIKPVKRATNVLSTKKTHLHLRPVSQANEENSTSNNSVEPSKANNANQSSNFANSKLNHLANTKLGDPYVWGATGANAFDCSGFTQYLYKNAKNVNLPRTAQAQYDYEKHVSYDNIKPGNLVFFGYAPTAISHVGMYVGNGQMIDAQNRGVVVENVKAPWWNLVGCAQVLD